MPLTEMKEEFEDEVVDELENAGNDENLEEELGDDLDDGLGGSADGIDGEFTAEEHEAGEAEDTYDQEEDDKKNYSEKVNRRIGREVSRRKVIETERDVVRNELHKAQEELAKVKSDAIKAENERLANEIKLLQDSGAKALEEGENATYLEMNDRMVDAKVRLANNQNIQIETPPPPQQQNGVAPAAQSWMSRNAEWIKSNPAKFERAKRISNKLESEGYAVTDESLYNEMDRRLNQAQQKPTGDTGHVPNGGQGNKLPGRRVGLTAEDKQTMAGYNLNPNNAEHRKAWLAGKRKG